MQKINFNDRSFNGFLEKEDILLDTGVLIAYLSEHDTWHTTVKTLFENHIFNNDNAIFLYINPCVLNEITHLTTHRKTINNYLEKHPEIVLTDKQKDEIEKNTLSSLKILIDNDILIPLDGDKDTYLKQVETCKALGSADAFNASLASEFGISFLTVDNKLVYNIESNIAYFKDMNNLYYTTAKHKDY